MVVAGVIMVVLERPVRQLVVADDASTDGRRDKLQPQAEGEPRIKRIRHSGQIGAKARRCVRLARTRPSSSPGRGLSSEPVE